MYIFEGTKLLRHRSFFFLIIRTYNVSVMRRGTKLQRYYEYTSAIFLFIINFFFFLVNGI